MQFSEKLNFLMDITKTTNSALAHYVSLDASYISRLRTGKRLHPRSEESIGCIAAYFARNCREEYKKKAIADALELHPFPEDASVLTKAITSWLFFEKEGKGEIVGRMLSSLSAITWKTAPDTGLEGSEITFPRVETAVYYGVEGKRRAVVYVLSEMISLEKPQTLLLFSDEETSWMTEDAVFARQWAALMFQTLAQGHRIKIIHTISRDLDEMLSAVSQWMPLYMTGNIEPYFYPKKRDGVFRRTLFIAPGTAALVSNSVGNQPARAANVLFRDPEAVAAYEDEFLQYLRLCRPLMRVFTAKDKEAYLSTLSEFEKEQGNALLKTESLSLLTMPEALFSQMFSRIELPDPELPGYHRSRSENLRKLLQSHNFAEIVVLPEPNEVMAGKVKVALSNLLCGGTVYYTPDEYLLHLQNIIMFLDTYKNYNVHLVKGPVEDRYTVYVKEELGVIVAKTSQPPVVLAMSEENMTASFWDFLKIIIGEKAYENPNKKAVINSLKAYIQRLSRNS